MTPLNVPLPLGMPLPSRRQGVLLLTSIEIAPPSLSQSVRGTQLVWLAVPK